MRGLPTLPALALAGLAFLAAGPVHARKIVRYSPCRENPGHTLVFGRYEMFTPVDNPFSHQGKNFMTLHGWPWEPGERDLIEPSRLLWERKYILQLAVDSVQGPPVLGRTMEFYRGECEGLKWPENELALKDRLRGMGVFVFEPFDGALILVNAHSWSKEDQEATYCTNRMQELMLDE